MGTRDTWFDEGSPAGGVGTITRPGADPAADPAAQPGVRRGAQARPALPVPPAPVPPRRTGRPGKRRPGQAGSPGQTGRPPRPAQPTQPTQPTQPAQQGQAGRPGQSPAPGTAAGPDAARGVPRTQQMPFFLVLCCLLGGALVSALVISTTLAAGSFQITRLQQANNTLARQRQMLQDEVAAAQSAQVIEQRALRLGMRPVGELRFLDLKNGKVETDAASGPLADIDVPGYTP